MEDMSLPWFKVWSGDYLSDPKTRNLTSHQHSCWLHLLCFAANSTIPGVIEHLNEELLMTYAGVTNSDGRDDRSVTRGVLKLFEERNMITVTDGKIIVNNWGKRQNTALSHAERQSRYRKNQQKSVTRSDAKSDAKVTYRDKIRGDKKEWKLAADAALTPFSWKEYKVKLRNDPRDHVQLIGHYFHKRGLEFDSVAAAQVAIARHSRAAIKAMSFSREKINEAIRKCQALDGIDWTLETVVKMLTK